MSTKLTEHPHHWVVETVVSRGKQRKIGRGAVRVGKGDPAARKAEMMRQAIAARAMFQLPVPPPETVD